MGEVSLQGSYDGRTFVFDADVLEKSAAVIRERIGGDPEAILEAFRRAIVPQEAWGLIPNSHQIVDSLNQFVVDLASAATRAPGLAADLASRALAASELVAKAEAETSHAAGQMA